MTARGKGTQNITIVLNPKAAGAGKWCSGDVCFVRKIDGCSSRSLTGTKLNLKSEGADIRHHMPGSLIHLLLSPMYFSSEQGKRVMKMKR